MTTETKIDLALMKRDIIDVISEKVQQFVASGEINLPQGYSFGNALKSAWLILQELKDKDQRPALQVCTKASIHNALLDMIVQGLNPGKKQCYFIVYGNQLTCERSYFGTMAVAKMVCPDIADFGFNVIYEGDIFHYTIKNGKKIILEHEQDIENLNKAKIKGAYAIALGKNGEPLRTEIMSFAEIKQSWKQSRMNPIDERGNVKETTTHGKFTADMAIRTVIEKLCKPIINSSSDNALLLARINRTDEEVEEADEIANTGEQLEIPE